VSGGSYSLSGTAGQPAAGISTGGSISLTAGYWATEMWLVADHA
jgi:hypothetical protein